MKRYYLLALIACLSFTSTAVAQRNFFKQLGNEFEQQSRQILRQDFGVQVPNRRQEQGGDKPVQSFGGVLPSEGGNQSGGQGQIFNPNDGFGFTLPGHGGFQPNPGFNPGQPFNPGRPMPQPQYGNSRPIYPAQPSFQQPGQVVNGGSFVSSGSHSNSGLPSSPVMTDQYIMIRCPKTTSGSINYTLSSNRGNFGFTLSAGQEQRFQFGSGWTISYNDGSQLRRYRLEGGKTYSMSRNSTKVWQLFAAR